MSRHVVVVVVVDVVGDGDGDVVAAVGVVEAQELQ
jgi:hypothetical protein